MEIADTTMWIAGGLIALHLLTHEIPIVILCAIGFFKFNKNRNKTNSHENIFVPDSD